MVMAGELAFQQHLVGNIREPYLGSAVYFSAKQRGGIPLSTDPDFVPFSRGGGGECGVRRTLERTYP